MSAIYQQLAPKLKGVCYRYTGTLENAEDLLQETFIIIFTKIDSYKEDGSFEGWCRRIAVNTCINWIRKNKQTNQMTELNPNTAEEEDVNIETLYDIDTNKLMEAITKLPDGYRTILNMFALENYSHREIANTLGINEATSRSQYARAKKLLEKLLSPKVRYEQY